MPGRRRTRQLITVKPVAEPGQHHPAPVVELLLADRVEYNGVSCRPTTVAPGPRTSSLWLRLRCRVDRAGDRWQGCVGKAAWRGVGLLDRLAALVGQRGSYRRVPALRRLRSPKPLVAPVFIVGSPRTGTTILGTILGCQGDVFFLSEARPIWFRAVPELDESRFHWANGEVWGRILLTERDYSDSAKQSLDSDFGKFLRWSRKKRLMEKFPQNLFRIPWLRAMWPDAKFVQILRDPFSTTASKAQSWPSIDEKQLPGVAIRRRMYGELFPQYAALLDSARTAYEWYLFEWRIDTEMGERLAAAMPHQLRIVRLEDAQIDPEPFCAGICEFAGLRMTNRLRRAYQTMLNAQVRMAKPQLDRARCIELLGQSAERWGYGF